MLPVHGIVRVRGSKRRVEVGIALICDLLFSECSGWEGYRVTFNLTTDLTYLTSARMDEMRGCKRTDLGRRICDASECCSISSQRNDGTGFLVPWGR